MGSMFATFSNVIEHDEMKGHDHHHIIRLLFNFCLKGFIEFISLFANPDAVAQFLVLVLTG